MASSFTSSPVAAGKIRFRGSGLMTPRDRAAIQETKHKTRNLRAVAKKLVAGAMAGTSGRTALPIPEDPIARENGKRSSGPKKPSTLTALHRKLFSKADQGSAKALPETKTTNTRTLAMVLRSERELLDRNKQFEAEISVLQKLLEDKDREMEKLRDLCLKQKEEIKALKNAILFPDDIEMRDPAVKQPNPDRKPHYLDDDLREARFQKCAANKSLDAQTPRTPIAFEDITNIIDYSSRETLSTASIGNASDIYSMDFNPCLTP